MKDKTIFLIDMQSFYASVEKASRPQYRDLPLVVAGDPERRSGIVLAACPVAKGYGVSTAEALGEALGKCPELVVVRPHMQTYIDVSLQITGIMERFSDLVEPFSIDEQFIDVSGSLALFGGDLEAAAQIQRCILEETQVYARVGIGPNKVLAKMACDNFAKKNGDGIFRLDESNMREKLWPLAVDRMYGVGRRMAGHFHRLGIHAIGDLARYPLDKLKQRWGIPGHVLWMTANGIDYSPVKPTTHDSQKAVGHNMTLPRDYARSEEIKIVLLELCEEVCRRARGKGLMGETASLGCRGADFDRPTGFYRQAKLAGPTNHAKDLFKAACRLFDAFWDGEPVRSVGVALSQLREDDTVQLDLFRDVVKERSLDRAVDSIKAKYGTAAIVRLSSITVAGQAYERSRKIGGHAK